MVVHPSFNSIAKAGFNFLLNDFGCKIDIKKETWLLSVTFENEKLKVSIELSDKDFYFNVLVTLNNQLSCVPLWAICKIEKLDTGLLTGSIINQGSLETMCNNSGKHYLCCCQEFYNIVVQNVGKLKMCCKNRCKRHLTSK